MGKEKEVLDNKLISLMQEGYALHEIILNKKGKAIDYRFIKINKSFKKFTGIKGKIVGKKVTEVIPLIKKSKFDWIKTYGEIALKGIKKNFEAYSENLDSWYKIIAYSPKKNYFVTLFENITEQKKNQLVIKEEELQQKTISNILSHFIDTNEAEKKINSALKKLGEIFKLDSVGILNLEEKKEEFNQTYNWSKPGSPLLKKPLNMVSRKDTRNFLKMLKSNDIVFIDANKIKIKNVKNTLNKLKIKSTMNFPFYIRGKIMGFMSYNTCDPNYEWDPDKTEKMKMMSQVFSSFIDKNETENELKHQMKILEQFKEATVDQILEFEKRDRQK